MTLTSENTFDSGEVNQRVKCLDQMPFRSKVLSVTTRRQTQTQTDRHTHTNTHTHTSDQLLYLDY